jgi:hypothetical protein
MILKRMLRFQVLILMLCGIGLNGQNQEAPDDSIARKKETDKKIYSVPRRASIMSAIIPGLGQAYNKRYWKIPVIYVVMGGFGYLHYVSNTKFTTYRQALRYSEDNNGIWVLDNVPYTTTDLQELKKYYKKLRDIGAIGMGFMYLLNIIDANVDAHLRTFDVSDDLSMNIRPWIIPGMNNSTGFGLSMKFDIH